MLDNQTHPQSIEALLYMPPVSAAQTSRQLQERMAASRYNARIQARRVPYVLTGKQLCRLPSPDSQMSHLPASVCRMACLFHRPSTPTNHHCLSANFPRTRSVRSKKGCTLLTSTRSSGEWAPRMVGPKLTCGARAKWQGGDRVRRQPKLARRGRAPPGKPCAVGFSMIVGQFTVLLGV